MSEKIGRILEESVGTHQAKPLKNGGNDCDIWLLTEVDRVLGVAATQLDTQSATSTATYLIPLRLAELLGEIRCVRSGIQKKLASYNAE